MQRVRNTFAKKYIFSGMGQISAKAMVNSILCCAWAALVFMVIHHFRKGKWSLLLTINASLSGMDMLI